MFPANFKKRIRTTEAIARSFDEPSSTAVKYGMLALIFFTSLFYLLPAHAATGVASYSAADMIENIASQIPQVRSLVTAVAFVMGIVFVFTGVMKLKHAGEMRTMMSHEHSLKGPLLYIAVGAALVYLPSSLQVGLSTFWTSPNPYGYVVQQNQWAQFISTCLSIIQLFGVIAFIRGLVMLAHLGGQGGGHQGGLGKALTHIIGGIFCINIYQFVQVVMVTLGIQLPF
jgi:hypothetical protein